jgi:predicted nucleotidyltransferase
VNQANTSPETLKLLAHVKERLHVVCGDRLRGVLLYGSQARGEQALSSDVDILVLLAGPVALGRDLRAIIHALYPLELELGRPIHAMPVDIQTYEAGEYSWFRNAKREGILV